MYIELKEYDLAVASLTEAAAWFHPDAQYRLAFCYEWGLGVKEDITKAAVWYKRAAQLGHVKALLWLGDRYSSGEGADEKARAWREQAHEPS